MPVLKRVILTFDRNLSRFRKVKMSINTLKFEKLGRFQLFDVIVILDQRADL